MKINLISDIHATISEKTGEVFYQLPSDIFFSRNELLEKLNNIKNIFKDSANKKQILKNLDFMIDAISSVEDPYDLDISVKKQISKQFVDIKQLLYKEIAPITLNHIIDTLHKFTYDFYPSKLEPADYLIIAGDIGTASIYDKVIDDIREQTKGKFKDILHIAGNHDHWYTSHDKDKPSKINLEHDYFSHIDGDYVFLGCTLWTPIRPFHEMNVCRGMNDYRYIPGFSTKVCTAEHINQVKWLKENLEKYKDKKVIVFSHHQPFKELSDDDYNHNGYYGDRCVIDAYSVNDGSLDDINCHGNIKVWCCGHNHHHYDNVLHGVRVVKNPIGYRDHYGYTMGETDPANWYNTVITID